MQPRASSCLGRWRVKLATYILDVLVDLVHAFFACFSGPWEQFELLLLFLGEVVTLRHFLVDEDFVGVQLHLVDLQRREKRTM